MDRKSLLEAVKGLGYTGKADKESVKAWLVESGYDPDAIESSDGEAHKIDEVWEKAAKVGVKAAAPEPEPVKKGGGFGVISKGYSQSKADYAKKSYERRAREGKTVYADADIAELAGAWFRLSAMTASGERPYSQRDADIAIITKASSTFANVSAGALVPSEFVAEVIDLAERGGALLRAAGVTRMTANSTVYPRQTSDDEFTCLSEGGSIPENDTKYGPVELVPREWGFISRYSNALLDDAAVSVSDEFGKKVAKAWGRTVDNVVCNGDGTSTYGGTVGLTANLPSGAYIAQGTSNTWASQTIDDFMKVIGSVENVGDDLSFVCSRQYYHQVMARIALKQGGVNAAETVRGLVPTSMASDGPNAMFLGYPVYFTPKMPTATATSHRSCYFGDFKNAMKIGLRRELQVQSSEQRYFDQNQIAFRAIARFAVNVHGDGKGSTFGPIVALKTS